mgnify:CR=1 FL=1
MLDELLPYYERELSFLRQHAGEFASRHPKIARRLQLERDQCEDPHVERLIEAFAFLSARIHRRLDDDFPEISEAFLNILYPHYTRPIPSLSILQLLTDPNKPEITSRYRIPRHQAVLAPPVNGIRCAFRLCYDVDLWPITLDRVTVDLAVLSEHLRRTSTAQAAITLEFTTLGGVDFEALPMERLRLFLDGDPGIVNLLYELLFTQVSEVRISDGSDRPEAEIRLGKEALRPVGFEPEDALFDCDPRSFQGYRLLTELFTFPEKFHFLDIVGLDLQRLRHPGRRLRIQFHLQRFEDSERHQRLAQQLCTDHFKLGCSPIINLFRQPAEPVRLTHQRVSYPVVVDHRRPLAYEVYSIDRVSHVEQASSGQDPTPVQPFYALSHPQDGPTPRFYWYATREASSRNHDRGTELHISLVDLDFQPVRSDAEILSLDLTCTNRDLPEQIPYGGLQGSLTEDFTLPTHAAVKRSRLLRKPTPTVRPPGKRGHQWRLITHLTNSRASLLTHGKEALQEILQLYNLPQSVLGQRQIQGIHHLESAVGTALLPGPNFSCFVRGVDVFATFDESFYAGSNLFVFASVLERYFTQCCPPNSFVRFHMLTRQREGEVAQWPPRAGNTLLI